MKNKFYRACESCGKALNRENPKAYKCEDADICNNCYIGLSEEEVIEKNKMKGNIEVGDWIRFYQEGRLVIGVVEYITYDRLKHPQYNTDQGVTTNFVEIRRNEEES